MEVVESIRKVDAAGDFAVGNFMESFPNPGFSVDGGAPIQLPLSPGDAQALADKARNPSLGTAGQSSGDKNLSKISEIDAKRISFRNPSWIRYSQLLVLQIATELGVAPSLDRTAGVHAEFSKSVLYEPGATFKDHEE